MTNTARADIGAGLKPDRSVGLGAYQTCDDGCRFPATISIGSLLYVCAAGPPTGIIGGANSQEGQEKMTHSPSCIRMLPESMSVQVCCSSPSSLIEIPIQSEAFPLSLVICKPWPTG
jgi:hypothetical protein